MANHAIYSAFLFPLGGRLAYPTASARPTLPIISVNPFFIKVLITTDFPIRVLNLTEKGIFRVNLLRSSGGVLATAKCGKCRDTRWRGRPRYERIAKNHNLSTVVIPKTA